ncbi:head GIN domain-containing protein [Salinibacter altiplanensis]|uniref:head GIN domain-containing protein n=1 Tax=Salinibacter altiplanensis TaxID=1803181 RepID=UPI000C9F9D74|nr:head GIN domain-containing protein [Salinibacter altiplanensis]
MLPQPSVWRTALFLGLLVLPLHNTVAQERVREARSVEAFTAVAFHVPGTLHLRQGDARSVEIEAPRTVLDEFEAVVENGTLTLPTDQDTGILDRLFGDEESYDAEVDIYVTAPAIESASLAGSGEIVGENQIEAETFSLNVTGSGRTTLDVSTDRLDVQVAGSGTTTLRGRAGALSLNIAGSGDLRAAELETRTTEVRIAGSGGADVHVTEQLEASIFGSGDVGYRGRPAVSTNITGSGNVNAID